MAVEVSSSCRTRQYGSDLEVMMGLADLLVFSARGVPKAIVSKLTLKQTAGDEHTEDGPSSSRDCDQVRPTW